MTAASGSYAVTPVSPWTVCPSRAKLATQGAVPEFMGPQEFTARIRTELATWREIARSAGIKAE